MYPKIKLIALATTVVITTVFASQQVDAQYSRANVLRQAQARGQNLAQAPRTQPIQNQTRVAQGSGSRSLVSPTLNTGSPIVGTGQPTNGAPIVGGPSPVGTGGYVPAHGQHPNQFIDSGSPIVADSYIDEGYVDGGCGCNGGGCDNCAVGSNFFNCRTGGCGPCALENCWINALGGLFSNAEVFGGAHAFRSRNFTAGTQLIDDSSFGLYGGANLGLSLCKLSCGLFSGQIGVRSSQSEFEGDFFSADNRDQLFLTFGIFRRVDYGLQLGVVADFLHEEWFAETDVSQVRGDIGWVYPTGNTMGFRFAIGTEDDLTSGIVNGVAFDNLFAEIVDNYRFYYRMMAANGGHCDAYVGWSDESDTVFGLDVDMPVNGCWGVQAGFNYFLPEENDDSTVANITQDTWNLYVGFAVRPQGLSWYRNYDRPLFNVADNGTLVFTRN